MVRGVVFVGFFVYVMMALHADPCCCNPVMSSEVENIARPTRPKTFGSPDELRSYLDQLGQYLAVVSRPRFGKRKPTTTSDLQQQRAYNSVVNREYYDEPYKSLQYKPMVIRNSKDLYDLLFSSRPHEHANNNNNNNRGHQFYVMQQDNADAVGLE